MLLAFVLLILGFALLIKGAGWLVDGASALAKKNNISDLAIGLTIVAFGTSAPELVVNVFASVQNHQGIVFGNVIGSNNFNLLAILGIAGLIAPLTVQASTVWKEVPLSLVAAIMVIILANDTWLFGSATSMLGRIDGFILIVFFALFLLYVYKQLKAEPTDVPGHYLEMSNLKIWGFIIVGLAGLVIGGKLVVSSAVDIAELIGISEKVIGLTIIAAGTSLPELATTVVAVRKNNNDIAVGNVVGSNIFNIFFILAASALINPITYDTAFNIDLYVLIGGTTLVFITMFTGKKKKLDRWEAFVLLATYVGYVIYLIKRGG